MRASIVVALVVMASCSRETSTSNAGSNASPASKPPSVAASPTHAATPGPTPTKYPTDQPWFDATATSCTGAFATGGHRYALSCRGDACACTTDGAPGESFSSSGCGLEEWKRCGHPSKPAP